MNFEIIKELEKEQLKAEVPQFATGDTVRVHNRIKEGTRERVQIFEGTVIKIQGGGARTTFTVRTTASALRRPGPSIPPMWRTLKLSAEVKSEEPNCSICAA